MQETEYVVEQIDVKSHRTREIYALHGLCMYLSQGLEMIMSILLASCYFTRPRNMTREKYDRRLEAGFRRTFGMTVNEWCKHETDADLCARLRTATETRNMLGHRYFRARAGHFMTDEGVEFMHEELCKIRDELEDLDHIFHERAIEHNKLLGIPDEFLERQAKLICEESVAHVNSMRAP